MATTGWYVVCVTKVCKYRPVVITICKNIQIGLNGLSQWPRVSAGVYVCVYVYA